MMNPKQPYSYVHPKRSGVLFGIHSISTLTQSKDYTVAGNQITGSFHLTRVGDDTRTTIKLQDVQFAYDPNGVKLEELDNGFATVEFFGVHTEGVLRTTFSAKEIQTVVLR